MGGRGRDLFCLLGWDVGLMICVGFGVWFVWGVAVVVWVRAPFSVGLLVYGFC